jgi:hypothetical protein
MRHSDEVLRPNRQTSPRDIGHSQALEGLVALKHGDDGWNSFFRPSVPAGSPEEETRAAPRP